jgi:type II pantothenate kinase
MSEQSVEVGLDIGATLAKIALWRPGDGGVPSFELLPSRDLSIVAAHVEALEPSRAGVTGGGAARLVPLLECKTHGASEFDAWGAGAAKLLRGAENAPAAGEKFLLVSLGTGTSILLVDAENTIRVGGTALGGGAVVGLGAALTGAGFKKLCELAARGDAAAVDLRVSDIYGPDQIPLAGDLTASNFGKLARDYSQGRVGEPDADERAHRAAGVMRLVGENVALICAGLAVATGAKHVVYGGSTVRGNTRLVEVLAEVTTLCGLQSCFLPHGGFAGALGALELARRAHVSGRDRVAT